MSDPTLPTAWSNLIEAITLLAKHQNNDTRPFHCSDDTLIVNSDPDMFTPEEVARLDELGFFPDSVDEDCFKSYRYGSA